MKIVSIEQNKHNRNFLSIEIEENESCQTEPFVFPNSQDFFPKDKSGQTHEVNVRKWTTQDLTGRTVEDHGTYNVGCGRGPAMGWTLGLKLEEAVNLAKGICAAIESMPLVAQVCHNIQSKH